MEGEVAGLSLTRCVCNLPIKKKNDAGFLTSLLLDEKHPVSVTSGQKSVYSCAASYLSEIPNI